MCAGLFVLGGLLPGALQAQTCIPPDCRGTWLTEFRLGRFNGFSGDDRESFLVSIHGGYMWSLSERDAVGAAALVGANDIDGYGGMEGRYRRWLTDDINAELGVGVIPVAGESLGTPIPFGSVSLNYREYGVAFHVQTIEDLNPVTDEFVESETVTAIVLRAGGRPGRTTAVVVAALVAFAWLGLAAG